MAPFFLQQLFNLYLHLDVLGAFHVREDLFANFSTVFDFFACLQARKEELCIIFFFIIIFFVCVAKNKIKTNK